MNVGVRQPVVDAWSSLYREDKEKFFHGHYLWSVEQYLLNRNFSLTSGRGPITFEQNKSWGYTLIADIKFEPKSKPESRPEIEKKYSHSPRSDWQLKIQDTPCLHIEVTSDPRGERDKERMLIQAACLVRLVNKHQYAGEPKFVDVCIYIDASLRASRYLVYQPLAGEPRVCCPFHLAFPYYYYTMQIEFVVRQFDLTTERGRVQFLIELYNFPLAAQHWNFEKVKDFKILQAAKNLVLEGFTNTTNPGSSNKGRRTDTSQSRDHSSRGSTARGSDSTHPYDDPSVEERLSQNGYHLIKDIKLPGWTRLNPVCLFLVTCKETVIKSRNVAQVDTLRSRTI
ncbi:hypothetical protein M408DRAFT_228623 [Serendipita vermifera MAFF 305830]|uniref:Uncharacterized protein n=1 Tax=Serendipita vermifera MAFF 305830 TaxID=933852 RepID=A0A0C3AY65_SERVB|nr:hypothetical protein M408DRAFT_228623 [Serendipita vermifera MAFF 305830]